MEPLVSIVVPVYNQRLHLDEAGPSLLAETCMNSEANCAYNWPTTRPGPELQI